MEAPNFKTHLIVIFLFTVSFSFSQNLNEFFTKSNVFFNTYVENGKVNYKAIKANDATLRSLVENMQRVTVSTNNANTYKAFWINSYNLTVIKSIVEKYPINSPLDIAGFFDKITHHIANKKLTLNDIENKMLRAKFDNDPRFHFVLVCAGLGCPPLISKAYLPNTLEKQLNKQTKTTINNPSFIQVNMKRKKVSVSQIFEWYKKDFTANNQSIIGFLNQYILQKIPLNFKTNYYTYNWKINKIN